jgi:hypothetical protein
MPKICCTSTGERPSDGSLLQAVLQLGEVIEDTVEIGTDHRRILAPICAHFQVLAHAHVAENLATFGDLHHTTFDNLVRGHALDAFAVEANAAGLHGNEAGYGVEGRRLTGTVAAEECNDAPFRNAQ